MKYAVRHTFGSFIHEGTRAECELVMKAFATYGVGEFKFDIVEIPTPKLSDKTREEIHVYLADMTSDNLDTEIIEDLLINGCKGFAEMTDEELVEALEPYIDFEESEADNTELYMRACAELGIERMLGCGDLPLANVEAADLIGLPSLKDKKD